MISDFLSNWRPLSPFSYRKKNSDSAGTQFYVPPKCTGRPVCNIRSRPNMVNSSTNQEAESRNDDSPLHQPTGSMTQGCSTICRKAFLGLRGSRMHLCHNLNHLGICSSPFLSQTARLTSCLVGQSWTHIPCSWVSSLTRLYRCQQRGEGNFTLG